MNMTLYQQLDYVLKQRNRYLGMTNKETGKLFTMSEAVDMAHKDLKKRHKPNTKPLTEEELEERAAKIEMHPNSYAYKHDLPKLRERLDGGWEEATKKLEEERKKMDEALDLLMLAMV